MRALIPALLLALVQPFLALEAVADTVELSGVKYDTVAEVGGQKLLLNGAGIRYKAIFKVYTAGLYLKEKAGTPEAALAATGPKRIQIVMLRDIDGNELGKLFTKGMEQNTSREEFIKTINGVLRIAEIFASRKELTKGEYFSVDYLPGIGSVVLVNGKQQGEAIKEPEFINAMLRIWLGKSPADDQLKDALLGVVKKSGRERN